MKTVTKKTTYRANDGKEFADPKACERYEQLTEAKRAYAESREALGRLLAESFATADGERFQIGLHDYHFITPGYFAMPRIVRVDFWYRNWDFEETDGEQTTLVLLSFRNDNGEVMEGRRASRRIPINELYYDERNAQKALLVAQQKWLDDQQKDLEERKTAAGE